MSLFPLVEALILNVSSPPSPVNVSTPSPVFADTKIALDASIPITSSICFLILSGSEEGRSILFKTGIIS